MRRLSCACQAGQRPRLLKLLASFLNVFDSIDARLRSVDSTGLAEVLEVALKCLRDGARLMAGASALHVAGAPQHGRDKGREKITCSRFSRSTTEAALRLILSRNKKVLQTPALPR